MNKLGGLTLSHSMISPIAYADDITFLGDNMEIVKKHCKKVMKSVS